MAHQYCNIFVGPDALYCRLCLHVWNETDFKQLSSLLNPTETIVNVIEAFANVKVVQGDEHSKLICLNCLKLVTAVKKFKDTIESSDHKLRNRLAINDLLRNFNKYLRAGDKNREVVGNVEEPALENSIKEEEELILGIESNDNVDESVRELEKSDPQGSIDNNNSDSCSLEHANNIDNREYNNPESDDEKINIDELDLISVKKELDDNNKLLEESKEYTFQCGNCNKTVRVYHKFVTRSNGRRLLSDYRFCTEKCSRKFKKQNHPKQVHCTICNEKYLVQDQAKHRLTHITPSFPYQCTVCHEKFSSKKLYAKHSKIHPMFKCQICNERFKYRLNLSTHEKKMHSCDDLCDICGRKVKNIGVHREIHTKRFQCHICHISFSHKTNFNCHMYKHTNNAFKCSICGKVLTTEKSLFCHTRAKHNDRKKFKCEVCKRKFHFKLVLRRHMRNKHSKVDL